ncbi:hypothetical protein EFN49_06450 [Leuconostoc citreum]|uniref:hypothetical protein n=1 Tax=Leuconostoc citreum TaxID=33964 RepID=UPI0021A6D96B|nr:hypothetical protein [Leuconostoc citreum]MCT3075330.1 hypothetical protein [Leuconostoc citreum]
MQKGHPRHKQLKRAKHDMALYRRRKSKEMAESLILAFKIIGGAAAAAGRLIAKYFRNTH